MSSSASVILCFYFNFLLLSSRGSSGMSKTRELTNRISCLDLSPKYRKRPEKLVDVGVQVGLFAFIWVFTFDISFPMFCRPDCLFFFGGGDRLNHRPQSCADGTWTWFAFTTGGIESVHSSGILYFWQQSGKWVHFKVKIYCQSWESKMKMMLWLSEKAGMGRRQMQIPTSSTTRDHHHPARVGPSE